MVGCIKIKIISVNFLWSVVLVLLYWMEYLLLAHISDLQYVCLIYIQFRHFPMCTDEYFVSLCYVLFEHLLYMKTYICICYTIA